MSDLSVLVAGAGIAGSSAAYWLGRGGVNVTLLERASGLRKSGLGIDVRGPAVEVLRKMEVEEMVRERTTKEEAFAIVDTNDCIMARFAIDAERPDKGPTAEIEIMRSELAAILSDKALELNNVEALFGTYIEAMSQTADKVAVEFANGTSETYDLVIGADGLGSKTRKMILSSNEERKEVFYSLGQFVAYFTIPRQPEDGKLWKWYNAPGRRCLMTRPRDEERSCAYLAIIPENEEDFSSIMSISPTEQKERLTTIFRDAGWQALRLVNGMQDSQDFYMQQVAQVRAKRWSQGRCALVGDAAYCAPGLGTSLALLGGYVLAGEILKAKGDSEVAFHAYEEKLRPYVTSAQKLPPGIPKIANPQTAWGVWISHWVLWFVASAAPFAKGLGLKLPEPPTGGFEVPDYDFEQEVVVA